MTRDEAMKELEACGNEQNRKTYARHGVGEDHFGVSYADLYALQKRIKKDHDLALALWDTGNHDARILATLILDPARMTEGEADAWVRSARNYVEASAVATGFARTPFAAERALVWQRSDEEWVARVGWSLLGQLAADANSGLEDAFFLPHLETIRTGIHDRKNRVREAMNGALIAIGSRSAALEEKALAVAAEVGKVHVDHGDTACKTPDAAAYIKKARPRQQEKAATVTA